MEKVIDTALYVFVGFLYVLIAVAAAWGIYVLGFLVYSLLSAAIPGISVFAIIGIILFSLIVFYGVGRTFHKKI